MPRNHLSGASTLRNRNRITNKTRLKIHHGNLDADALLIPDEDEEKHRLTNLVAGVDAEDANEHHLQEVLSAAHRNSSAISRSTKAAEKPPPAAFIPTPDSKGVADNYDEYYPANKWKDPATYVCTSECVEECIESGLAGGFTHYMDERDKEWLDKNNEEARGEGTSAQGALSASGTRTSSRSAKAKGKEPDVSQPIAISEDEFELVMGIFEKVTHEKTEYLHHGLENGMPFPPFSDYQDTFTTELPPSMFANYVVPSWVPELSSLSRIARTVFPYWKERRLERGGHRIIPALNGDETDTLNESYICFRRREIKAVRKTRASQSTSSDKLTRLQLELAFPLELANTLLKREQYKKECAQHAQSVWDKRLALVDLKRKYHVLGDKTDEDLLVDKERPVKKVEPTRVPGINSIKLRQPDSHLSSPRPETLVRPRERVNTIREEIEKTLAKQKDLDHHWEDQIDNVYQAPPVPYASRLFKYLPSPDSPSSSTSSDSLENSYTTRPTRSLRLRIGRGGRRLLDRHDFISRPTLFKRQQITSSSKSEDVDGMDVDKEDLEEAEGVRLLEERWRYDQDDVPAVGPQGYEEQDRVLVDEYQTKYLRNTMTLLTDQDQIGLVPDNAIPVATPDGRQYAFLPFRLGAPPTLHRRDPNGGYRSMYPALTNFLAQPNNIAHPSQLGLANGTPVSMQQQLKKMPPPNVVPQMRISSNGGMRPPTMPTANGTQNGIAIAHTSPLQPVPVPQHSPVNGANGVASRPAIAMPHVDVVKTEVPQTSALANGAIPIQQSESSHSSDSTATAATSPARPKSQTQGVMPTNGFHLAAANTYAAALANTAAYSQLASNPTIQNLKTAFAGMPQDFVNLHRLPYMQMIPGATNNMQLNANNLKVAAARQMHQWANSPMQRPTSTGTMDGSQSSPNNNHVVPATNGASRPAMRVPSNGQMSMSPMPQHSPSPLPHIAQSQSPPRLPMTPTVGMASPSIQQQQAVGGSQIGY